MKNITTPRTLADCSFTTGYASAGYVSEAHRSEHRWHAVMYVLVAVFVVLFLTGLAGV